MGKIKIEIVGVGNCGSSLIQGIHYYQDKNREDAIGLFLQASCAPVYRL